MNTPDRDTDEARLARMRADCRTVHPDIAAARRTAAEALEDIRIMESRAAYARAFFAECDRRRALEEAPRLALANAQQALQTALGHLQAVLNKPRTHDEQQAADTAARNWLVSIGSEPDGGGPGS